MLLAAFGSLRWGKLAGLRRCDIDLNARTVTVRQALIEVPGGSFTFGPPKSEAGKRTVVIPDVIVAELRWHLNCFAQAGDEELVFVGPRGASLRRNNFRRRVWMDAVKAAGLSGTNFHDLRHTGHTWTADAGASLRELMERMGHSSTKAEPLYLHASDDRHRQLADALSDRAREELKQERSDTDASEGDHRSIWHGRGTAS